MDKKFLTNGFEARNSFLSRWFHSKEKILSYGGPKKVRGTEIISVFRKKMADLNCWNDFWPLNTTIISLLQNLRLPFSSLLLRSKMETTA